MTPLRVSRPRLLTGDDLQRIHEASIRLLVEVGLRLRGPEPEEAAQRLGLRMRSDRAFFERPMVEEFLEETRPHRGAVTSQANSEPEARIRLYTNPYPTFTHDLGTDEIVPFTTARLIEATKFLDTMAPHGVEGKVPGTPMDVPGDLQPIARYRIGALYYRGGTRPIELMTPRSVPYVLDMAEAFGHPITTIEVYVLSPLTVASNSFENALAGRGRFARAIVGSMPAVGASAPIDLGQALAQAVAEVVGGAIIAREVLGLPVDWSARACPFDPRALAITIGSPEGLLMCLANDEVNAWYEGGSPQSIWAHSFHTTAKLPGVQATAEKLSEMLVQTLWGARYFGGCGWLSLDEVFSMEQVVVECELAGHVQRLVDGVDVSCDPEACVSHVTRGIEGGFLVLDRTRETYRDVYWSPRLFYRGMLGAWQAAGKPEARSLARDIVRERLASYDFEPDPAVRRTADRIYERATRDLA